MKRSELFIKTRKDAPSDEVSKNAQLLIRAGYVHKVMAGVYAYTPLGIRVLEKIKQVVREEMEAIGSTELIMTSLQRPEIWQATDRWSDDNVDVWFKTHLKDDTELGLAWSHEEAIMDMMKDHVTSYKDLPLSVFQFQTKMRNELRSKSGIMRGREFVMKDQYSLHATQEDMDAYYDRVIEAYNRIFQRLGIGDSTFVTFASGGSFTKFSHEFQTVCDAGEDVLYVSKDRTVAVNEEVLDDAVNEIGIDRKDLEKVVTAEVGNIFKFGTEKSDKMNIHYTDSSGQKQPIFLASYGVGITRVMGVIAEKMSDDKGLVWDANIAPYHVYLATIGDVADEALKLIKELEEAGVEVLYDDRDVRPGDKFADADLMGIPYRLVLSARTLAEQSVELKERKKEAAENVLLADVATRLSGVVL